MKINVKEFRQAEDKEKYIRDKISERPGFWNDLPKMRIIPNHIKKGEFVFEVLENIQANHGVERHAGDGR